MPVYEICRVTQISGIYPNLPAVDRINERSRVAAVKPTADPIDQLFYEVRELVIAEALQELEVQIAPTAIPERHTKLLEALGLAAHRIRSCVAGQRCHPDTT